MKNYIREKCELCDVSIGTAERTVRDDLNLKKKEKKVVTRWIPHLPNDQEQKQRVECLIDLLKMFDPDGP